MRVASVLLALLPGCRGIDSLPIVAGERCASSREETVACVLDGDTFEVAECGGESVRLLGINAPEIAHPDAPTDECFGPESAAWLADFLNGVALRLEFDAECEDSYGRTLAYGWLTDEDGESVLVNAEILEAGMARVYEDFDDIRLADQMYAAQARAVAANAGLWAVCE